MMNTAFIIIFVIISAAFMVMSCIPYNDIWRNRTLSKISSVILSLLYFSLYIMLGGEFLRVKWVSVGGGLIIFLSIYMSWFATDEQRKLPENKNVWILIICIALLSLLFGKIFHCPGFRVIKW